MLALVTALVMTATALASTPPSLYEQRGLYKRALEELTAGRTSAYRNARSALRDYPLQPYLDYYELQSHLSTASVAQVRQFLQDHADLPVADIIHWRWLKRLGRRRDWQRLADNYTPSTDPELECYHLRALLGTGKRAEAFDGVAALWLVARSQPDECDPLFESWIEAGNLTESMVWQRLLLALQADERTLSRYLLRYFKGTRETWANELYEVHVDPTRITRISRYKEDNELSRAVIVHGLKRLARSDPQAAAKAWASHQQSHEFTQDDVDAALSAVLPALAATGIFPEKRPEAPSAALAEAMARAAVSRENWTQATYWIELLPAEQLNTQGWQYWLARALSSTYLGSERARLTYQALAEERDYYGFLAAERIGRQPQLQRAETPDEPAQLNALRQVPAITRALELYAVGDMVNARREWNQLTALLDSNQMLYAARLALRIGWIAQGVRTANAGNLRDNLELRFPLAFTDEFQRVSHVTNVPHSFLIAIARQESLFDPEARSPANARGLMQMLPTTAEVVARRAALPAPAITDLYNVATNAELGGHYLAWLLDRYTGSRPLAAAAYNAGENRVDRWKRAKSGMAMDVWIESIPFHETRNYVKNVLAFDQVYGQLLGIPQPMLGAHEAAVP